MYGMGAHLGSSFWEPCPQMAFRLLTQLRRLSNTLHAGVMCCWLISAWCWTSEVIWEQLDIVYNKCDKAPLVFCSICSNCFLLAGYACIPVGHELTFYLYVLLFCMYGLHYNSIRIYCIVDVPFLNKFTFAQHTHRTITIYIYVERDRDRDTYI